MVRNPLDEAVKAARGVKRPRTPQDRYLCLVCGYTYDPARGDPKGNIPPGTSGDDLPHDWLCPTCGKDQTHFARRDDSCCDLNGRRYGHSDRIPK